MRLKFKMMLSAMLLSACGLAVSTNVCAYGDSSERHPFKIHFGCRVSEQDAIHRKLRNAVERGDLESVRDVLENEVIWQDDRKLYGQVALLFASEAGKLDIVKYVVENGLFTSLDNWEDGPLFSAIEHCRFNVIDYLLSEGFRFVYPWWYGRDMVGKPASLSDIYGQSLDCWDFFEIENIFKKYGLN